MMNRFGSWLVHIQALLVISGLPSCESDRPPALLIVVVNSDFEPESQLHHVTLSVPSRETEQRTVLIRPPGSDDELGTSVPFSFNVWAREGAPLEQVKVQVDGFSASGELIGRVHSTVGFASGETRLLELQLVSACSRVHSLCNDAQTCRPGGFCASDFVNVSELRRAEPDGHELDGVRPLPPPRAKPSLADAGGADATVTANDMHVRPQCSANQGYFSDVGRPLARTLDEEQCPVVAQGDDWRGAIDSLASNTQALSVYLERSRSARADFLEINVDYVEGKLLVFGYPYTFPPRPDTHPGLTEVLALPSLQSANQPLWLEVAESNEPDIDEIAHALLETLAKSGAVAECRPVYLLSTGPVAFRILHAIRTQIDLQREYAPLRRLFHYGATVHAANDVDNASDLAYAAESGFDLVRLDLNFNAYTELAKPIAHAKQLGLAVSLLHSPEPWAAATLCGLADSVEQLLIDYSSAPAADFRNEVRQAVEQSRLLLELNVRNIDPGLGALSYRVFPSPMLPVEVDLDGDKLPTLVVGTSDPLRSGTFLQFDPQLQQHLVLSVAEDQAATVGAPALSFALVVRFAKIAIARGSYQTIISKHERGSDTGWALELRNPSGAPELALFHWLRGEDGTPLKAEVTLSAETFLFDAESVHLIYGQSMGGLVELRVLPRENPYSAVGQTVVGVHNDVPITLGADPGGHAGFLDGAIQFVRLIAP